jgi:hypothetical protein
MRSGYSYVTLAAGRDEPVRVGVSFHLDGRAWIEVINSGTDQPHLHVELGDVSANFSPRAPGTITAEDARIARELADKTAAYAAEIERLHTANPAPEAGGAAA